MRQSEYALDISASRIVSPRTQELFKEPLECFLNGAYRLAIVGLWTVVVFDLLEKVSEMADLYKDPVAQTLLTDVEEERKKAEAAKSPRWEPWLLEQVSKRTQLLEPSDTLNLEHLFALRNLCAHPILQQHSPELQNVRPETARACFVHALEGLLTKPALLTGQITKRLLEDLGARDWSAVRPDEFERYFAARYLDRLSESASMQLFRSLWKLTFQVDSVDAERARDELGQLVQILYAKDPSAYNKAVDGDGAFFGNIVPIGSRGEMLHELLLRQHGLFDRLPAPTRADFESYLKAAPQKVQLTAVYKYADLSLYVQSLEVAVKDGKLTRNVVAHLPELTSGSKEFDLLHNYAVTAWTESTNYFRSGDLSAVIEYVIQRATPSQLEELMVAANSNDQVYGCGLAADSCLALITAVRTRAPSLADKLRFPNLKYKIDKTV